MLRDTRDGDEIYGQKALLPRDWTDWRSATTPLGPPTSRLRELAITQDQLTDAERFAHGLVLEDGTGVLGEAPEDHGIIWDG